MPFVRLPFVKGRGKAGDGDNNILHFGSVVLRVNGDGTLITRIFGLDDVDSDELANTPMSPVPGRQITLLANLVSERCAAEISTSNMNDYFRINRVTVYSKFHATSYPM